MFQIALTPCFVRRAGGRWRPYRTSRNPSFPQGQPH